MNKVQLFCFPYAGGSAAIYSKWRPYLDPQIELVPVELAGRGRRMHEPLYASVQDAIEDVYSIVKQHIRQTHYALFGHSLGSMISYELLRKIRETDVPGPSHLFFSGRSAPHIKNENEKKFHLMNETDFRNEILALGGTPPDLFDHPELLEVFLPVLKNDFKLAESGVNNKDIHPVDINITVFLGKDDDLTPEQCDGWKKHTKQLCRIYYFEGGHFFLNDQVEQITRIINQTLLVH